MKLVKVTIVRPGVIGGDVTVVCLYCPACVAVDVARRELEALTGDGSDFKDHDLRVMISHVGKIDNKYVAEEYRDA